jgi:hypothetical protein
MWCFSRGAVGGGVAVVVQSPGVGVRGILRREVVERRWCVAGFLIENARGVVNGCLWCRKYTWSQNLLFQQFTMAIRSRMNIAL